MDEIFADVEQMLDRGALLPIASKPEAESSDWMDAALAPFEADDNDIESQPDALEPSRPSLDLGALAVVSKVSPRQLTLGEAEVDADILLDIARTEEEPQRQDSQSLDKLLIAIILATIACTAGFWFFVRSKVPQANPAVEAPSSTETLQAKQDAEFLDYVRRAVERIDRMSESEVASGSPSPTILERVYVLQPPAASLPTTPTSPRITTVPIPSSPPVMASPDMPPVAVAPVPQPQVAQPQAAQPQVDPSVAAIPNIAPSPTHVLIGLLELGDRSAALFEIDGTPQRIQVGERIGSSGWMLVSIANQEAIVRRNGEVRSIYIGQQF